MNPILLGQESVDGFRPELSATVKEIGRYDTIYISTPIWGMTAPPIIRSFLAAHEISGKTIVPVITHGGYGTGSSLSLISERAPGAIIGEPFVIEADQVRRTLDQVTSWLLDRTT